MDRKKSLIRIFFVQQNKNYLSLKNSFIIEKKKFGNNFYLKLNYSLIKNNK